MNSNWGAVVGSLDGGELYMLTKRIPTLINLLFCDVLYLPLLFRRKYVQTQTQAIERITFVRTTEKFDIEDNYE